MKFYYANTLGNEFVVDRLCEWLENVVSICVTPDKRVVNLLRCDVIIQTPKGQQAAEFKIYKETDMSVSRLSKECKTTLHDIKRFCEQLNKGFQETPLKMYFDED